MNKEQKNTKWDYVQKDVCPECKRNSVHVCVRTIFRNNQEIKETRHKCLNPKCDFYYYKTLDIKTGYETNSQDCEKWLKEHLNKEVLKNE